MHLTLMHQLGMLAVLLMAALVMVVVDMVFRVLVGLLLVVPVRKVGPQQVELVSVVGLLVELLE